mgnify:FL=1
MSIALTVLHSVLGNTESSLSIWSQLKKSYFPTEYQAIFRALSRFYTEHKKLPTLDEITLQLNNVVCESPSYSIFLEFEPSQDVDPLVALKLLVDEFTQAAALNGIEKLITKISDLTSEEVIENIANMAYELEQESDIQSSVYNVQDIDLFTETGQATYIPLGLNNTMDNAIIGVARSEVVYIGGFRGAGKSVICSNIVVNEYEAGFIPVYFTIEMRAAQVHRRNLGIEAQVDAIRLRNNTLTESEKQAVARTMCNKYTDGDVFLEAFSEHNSLAKLEASLKKANIKEDNQIIIVDNPHLSLVDIDTTLARLKARFGKKIRKVAIDYLNQIEVVDKYDWKAQIGISSKLKELANKHDVILAVPYQVDSNGEARFSKGILDAADYAILLSACKDEANPYLELKTTKARDTPAFNVKSVMNWSTLKISATEAVIASEEEASEL